MFDVSWTDPTRETVGQRKTRKEQSQNSNPAYPPRAGAHIPDRAGSIRSSQSGDSGSSKPSFLNLFGPSYRKTLPKRDAILQTKSTSTLRVDSSAGGRHNDRPLSSYTEDSMTQELPRSLDTTKTQISPAREGGNAYHSDTDTASSEMSESIFSGRTARSEKTILTWSSAVEPTGTLSPCPSRSRLVQPLSSNSFVTQSTEVTVSPRDSLKDVDEVATVVHISSAGTVSTQVCDSPSKEPLPPMAFDIPDAHRSSSDGTASTSTSTSTKEEVIQLQTKGWPISNRARWQPPDAWDCSPPDAVTPIPEPPIMFRTMHPTAFDAPFHPVKPRRAETSKTKRSKTPTVEMEQLQRSIRRMEAASDRIILERLKEDWSSIADASVYRDLELERQLWMLTALRRRPGSQVQELTGPGTAKVLSLYENHASCSRLSALTFTSQIHHLSTSPLSPKSWPNIHPLTVPGPTSQLPYASENFTSIHAFSLPALLPASSIPQMLKECHRTLISGPTMPLSTSLAPFSSNMSLPMSASKAGTLHLIILDPAPLSLSLGPKLRTWLDNHLILNLEKQFRCINPGRLFPVWLADAGLRAAGSTILPVQFLACYSASVVAPAASSEENEFDNGLKATGAQPEDNTKQELKSVIGRMLWKEMWGPFVEAENWWWEDEGVVEECERMRTCWEYAIIEAVKQP